MKLTKFVVVSFLILGMTLLVNSLFGARLSASASSAAQDARNMQQAAPWTPPATAYKISVDSDGMYELGFDALSNAGLPVGSGSGHLDPRTFRLFWMGREVPIQVVGEGDGAFDNGDALIFYGRGVDSLFYDGLLQTNKYTGVNIYWLTYGGSNGLRMAERDGSVSGNPAGPFLHTEHQERNFWYFPAYPFEPNADHWYWQWITTSVSRSYKFGTNNIAASGTLTGTLTVSMLGYADGPHHLSIYVNSNLVFDDDSSWRDFTNFTARADVPQADFIEGNNTIDVKLDSTNDRVYTNWLEVAYYDTYVAEGDVLAFGNKDAGAWRYEVSDFSTDDITVYDVSDMTDVKRFVNVSVTGSGPYTASFGDASAGDSRYLALTPAARLTPLSIEKVTPRTSVYTPTDLLDVANGADYILITHSDFWDESVLLALYRASDFRVALVDVQSIYDQFNGGMMSAEAIHDFLAYAYANWTQPAPEFVALMGDGSSYMRHYRSTFDTYIPPYLAMVDPVQGETAADNRFVSLGGDDPVPDMAIGRLPANSPEEARAMVDKIISYETVCQCGDWNYNNIFLSDNLEGGGGNFYDYSDNIADGYADPPDNTLKYVPENYTADKLYFGRTCDVDNPTTADECPAQMKNILDTRGAFFVSYIGHAATTYWAKEHLWNQVDVTDLTNGPCLPIMLGMTCFEGAFQDPEQQAMGEYQVRFPVHGAIASWSSSGNGLATGHDVLEKGLMLALFHENIDRLGAATDYAKRYLWEEEGAQFEDIIETYTLFGDPALKPKTSAVCQDTPTAIILTDLSASSLPGAVRLSWHTLDETSLLAFNVLRRDENATGVFVTVNERPLFARGEPGLYRFVDRDVEPDARYEYRLQILYLDGRETWQSLGVAGPRSDSVHFSSPTH